MNAKKVMDILIIYLSVFVVVLISFSFKADYTEVVFVDVGQGDGTLIKTQNGKCVLIDGGDEGYGKYTLDEVLKVYNCRTVDSAFISHLHEDHYVGIAELLENGFKINNIYVGDKIINTEGYNRLKAAADNGGSVINTVNTGDLIKTDNVNMNILYTGGSSDNIKDDNDYSVIMRCDIDGTSIMFTGDATCEEENLLLENNASLNNLKCDILKVGHHGSDTSSSDEFINAVNPEFAVISVGKDNLYNLPSDSVIEKFNKVSIPVLRTDYNGSVTIKISENSEKNILDIKTQKP